MLLYTVCMLYYAVFVLFYTVFMLYYAVFVLFCTVCMLCLCCVYAVLVLSNDDLGAVCSEGAQGEASERDDLRPAEGGGAEATSARGGPADAPAPRACGVIGRSV